MRKIDKDTVRAKTVSAKKNSDEVKKYYISNRTVHLGGIRKTVPKGTIITHTVTVDGTESMEINGEKITNMGDFNICMKYKFFDEATPEQVKNGGTAEKDVVKIRTVQGNKLPVYKSDQDMMPKQIDISDTKNEYMKQERATKEAEDKKSFGGFRIQKQVEQKIEDGIKISVTTAKASGENEIANEINGESTEVKKIGSEEKKVTAKRKPNTKAAERAAARKKESEANQKKLQEEKAKEKTE